LVLKQKYGIKWIADFRDPWTKIFSNQFLPRTNATIEKDKALEASVLQHADFVTVISPGMQAEFPNYYDKVKVLFNGFDKMKFSKPKENNIKEKGFLITYTGNFLASQNAPVLWDTLNDLKLECPYLRLLIIGRADDAILNSINKAGLNDILICKDFMPHNEVLNYMWHSHILLFMLANVKDNKLLMTGKVFEYLPTGTELMGIGPIDGSAQNVMKDINREDIIDYSDKKQMKERIETAYKYWKIHGIGKKNHDQSYLKFSVSKITEELALLLDTTE